MSAEAAASLATTDATRRPTLAHRLEFAALRGVSTLFARVSFERAGAIGARIGALGYAPLGIRRNVVERQIAAAFPEMRTADVHRTAREAYAHLGRVTAETAHMSAYGPERLREVFEPEVAGWAEFAAAREGGRGVMVVAAHLGNWELGGAYIAAFGRLRMEAVARHMSNPLADRWFTRTRARLDVNVVYDDQAVRQTPRALRAGHVVGFLVDQGVLGLASTFVPFFGRPAKTPRGPAVFAIRMGIPIFFAVALRQADGRYRLSLEQVPVANTGDREADVDATVAAYTRVIEQWVRKAPGQYFWHHRRWRRQPPDTPPELREPR